METVSRIAVEVLDSHGRVHMRERLALPADNKRFTVGRAVAADVMIDDPHAAALHASLEPGADGQWRITDLGSTNGVIVGGRRHSGARELPLPGGMFQIGRTRLRIRDEAEALAPEATDSDAVAALSSRVPLIAGAGALVCAFFTGYFAWLPAPRDAATVIIAAAVSFFVGLSIWTAIWALLTRVIRGEARWIYHAAIICGVGAVLLIIDWVIDLSWFAFALPRIPGREVLLTAVGLAAALYWHVTVAMPIGRRKALLWAIAVPLLIVGTSSWVEARKHTRDVNFIGEPAPLFPPAMRVRGGDALDAFFEAAAGLKNSADRKRKAIAGEDGGEAGDESSGD